MHYNINFFFQTPERNLNLTQVFSPLPTIIPTYTMLKYTIFAPIFPILVYSYVIYLTYLSYKNFSVLKTPQKPWNLPNVYFHPMPSQVPPKNSLPLVKISLRNRNQQIQKSILHNHIILFSNNSFAILSIPYLKFKNMNRPTSPSQCKKHQNVLKGQGKSFPEIINSEIPIPSITNNPMEEYIALPQNSNRMAMQEPQILAHLEDQSQDNSILNPSANRNFFCKTNHAVMIPVGVSTPTTTRSIGSFKQQLSMQSNGSILISNSTANNHLFNEINPAVMIPAGSPIPMTTRPIESYKQQPFMQSYVPLATSNPSANHNFFKEINPAVMIPAGNPFPMITRPIESYKQQPFVQSYVPLANPNPSANHNFFKEINPAVMIPAGNPFPRITRPIESYKQQPFVQSPINPSGKSLKPNPINNPNCETHINAPILLPTPTPNPNLETPFPQTFPLPLCSALPNPTYETLPNAPTPKPTLNNSPQYEPFPPINRITTNPFSEPLPLQVSSMSLHRNRTPTLTAIYSENPFAMDQQIHDHPEETIKPQIKLTGKSLKSNPISSPTCETHINVPILISTSTPNSNLETPLSQTLPLPICPALTNPIYETLPNAPTSKPTPTLNNSPQYESSPSVSRITTNPFSEPLPLQVSSTSLHRNRTPTLTAFTDATKLTPVKPIPTSLPSKITDEQQSEDRIPINRPDSNHPYIELYF